ncbi:MAG: CHAT domain-containing protein, partial [Cyanobacteria bacterium P01_A01_bin.37]
YRVSTHHATQNGAILVAQGREYYDATQYDNAVQVLEQAVTAFDHEQLPLNRALALSYLALSQHRLGQRDAAQTSIQTSRSIVSVLQTTSLATSPPSETIPASVKVVRAKVWNASGHLHLAWGQYEKAAESWRQSEADYRDINDTVGQIGSQINQAQAMQSLGQIAQASNLLERIAETLEDTTLELHIKALGLWKLGTTYRLAGSLAQSQTKLEECLEFIQDAQLSSLQNAVELDLGNTNRAIGERAIAIGKFQKANDYFQQAIRAYENVYRHAEREGDRPSINRVRAQLNHLSLALDINDLSHSTSQIISAPAWEILHNPATIQYLTQSIQSTWSHLSLSRDTLYARLNFAHSLIRQFPPSSDPSLSEEEAIAQFLETIIQDAQTLRDPKAESLALGRLGNLHEQQHEWDEAQSFTEQALAISQRMHANEIGYRWAWQLGRILNAQEQEEKTLTAYKTAVERLETVRNDLRFVDTDVQFSFRDAVEPLYREYVDVLLRHENGEVPSQDSLKQAVRRIDDLQLTELENFLSCDLGDPSTLVTPDPSAAIVHPILLADRLIVILELPDENQPLAFHEHPISREDVEAKLNSMRRNLRAPDRTEAVIESAQTIYQWIIEPFNSLLEEWPQVNTLVFVLDGAFRNIPMAVLHDGEHYLLEHYAVAIAPRLELFNPQPLSKNLRIFTGGIGEPQMIGEQRFIEIEYLVDELDGIRKVNNAVSPLLGDNFTQEQLQQHLNAGNFSAIHIKTHGVFSSDPDETFIVAFNELIRSRDLGNLIQASIRQNETPIELLVLSACATAQGDNRAVLGLAGVAVQAGVQSTLSTLWEAQDFPNTQLMIRFHEELANGKSRAEALRLAQLYLMTEFRAPNVWAPYVLVGNWL